MSVVVSGRLTIKYRNGRNGKFPVGELVCDIGAFAVKTRALEQYSEGTYEGKFVIARIEMASYTYNGSMNLYLAAKLDDFTIKNYQTGKVVEPEPIVPDPADEEEPVVAGTVTDLAVSESSEPQATESTADSYDVDFNLFGEELFEQIRRNLSAIKLDPSVGRAVLRQQADRMKNLDYRFEATTQTWHKMNA